MISLKQAMTAFEDSGPDDPERVTWTSVKAGRMGGEKGWLFTGFDSGALVRIWITGKDSVKAVTSTSGFEAL